MRPRAGQDALGAGVQDALGPGGEGGVEHVDRPPVVDRVELGPVADPQVRVGRQVVDPAPAPERKT